MLIVLAVTSRIVKATAMPIELRIRARSPAISRKLAVNCASVSVLVCVSLFSNVASTALATAAAWLGLFNWRL